MIHKERWRIIRQFPDYEISTLGRRRRIVPSKTTKVGRILSNRSIDDRGYIIVRLMKNKKPYTVRLHRLVLSTFTYQAPTGFEVNHINGKKTDNRLENLEWVTHKNNMKHAAKNRLIKSKLKVGEVWLIKKLIAETNIKQIEIAKMFNVSGTLIGYIKYGKIWRHVKYERIDCKKAKTLCPKGSTGRRDIRWRGL